MRLREREEIFSNHGRWHPLLRVVLYFAVYVVVAVLLSMPLLAAAPPALVEGTALLDPANPVTIASAWVFLVAALLVTYFFTARLDRQSWRAAGLWLHGGWPNEALSGLALGALLSAGIFLILVLTRIAGTSAGTASAGRAVLIGLVALLPWALTEEILMRGYLLRNLAQAWGAVPGLIVSALVFSVMHFKNPEPNILALINIALVGILLGYAYLQSGSLWFPFGLHFAWNFTQGSLLGMPVSGLGVPGIILTHLPNVGFYHWLTGGPFGAEASILGTVAIAAGMAFVVRRYGPPSDLPQAQANT